MQLTTCGPSGGKPPAAFDMHPSSELLAGDEECAPFGWPQE